MPRIVHFEIPYDDAGRAEAFYSSVFGWNIQGWGDEPTYQLMYSGSGEEGEPGIDGALYLRRDPDVGIVDYVNVPSVDDYLVRVVDAGAEIVQEKVPIPGVGFSAIFRDPEGNLIGLFESGA